MSRRHALKSPSSSKMWINCPPSAKRNAEVADESSAFAAEGTDAHSLCEHKLLKALGRDSPDPRENMTYLDNEMEEASDGYAEFVMEKVGNAHDPVVMVEQHVDCSEYADGCFGTADCVIISDGHLEIVDFKYGKGVPVSAGSDEEGLNTQLAIYALGALSAFDALYDISLVSMSIYQPRLCVAETYTITKDELLMWAKEVLAPAAILADKGEGEYKAGEHCRFCKVRAVCRKRAELNMELAKYDFAMPVDLEDDEVEDILGRADGFISWIKDIQEYALNKALQGKSWNGYKLVEGRSVRKYLSEDVVADVVRRAGYDPYERKIRGITAMTRLLGKGKFDELLGDLIDKPAGKPTLVSRSDKRPEMKNTAENDFMED